MFAYLDPASGSMILSAVAGSSAGAAVIAKSYGRKMKFWKKGDAEETDDADEPAVDEDTDVDAKAETGS